MTRIMLAAVFVTGFATAPAIAEQNPRSGGFDARVQVVAYNPLNVVRIVGSPNTSTQIAFAPGEDIVQVANGDAEGWLMQPTGNLLFLKPTETGHPTNATIVTRRPDGSVRSYHLGLVSVERGSRSAMFAVNFTYPTDERAIRTAADARAASRSIEQMTQQRLALSWAEGTRNWRYVAQGSAMIEPVEVSDNGRQTAFRFPGNMRLPTIYTLAPDGTETIVPYTTINEVVVVQTTARQFVLRDGQEVLSIVNHGFDPVGRNNFGTGTGTPDLTRTIRSSGL